MAEVDIIELWNKGKGVSSGEKEVNVDELISKNSRTPLYWIKIILWIEFWINLASLPFVYVMKEIEPVLYGTVMPIVVVVYLFYYQFLIQKIKKFDYTTNVLTGLCKLYNYLNFFFLHYKVLLWFSMTFSLVYALIKESSNHPNEGFAEFWLPLVGLGLAGILVIGLVFNFLINLIYGRKIKRLKKIIKELEKE